MITPNLYVREATAADVPLIHELATQTWWPAYSNILSEEQITFMLNFIYREEALLHQMEAGQVFLLLFGQAQEALGFAAFSLADAAAAVYKLNKIYLLPATQGKGAGKFLLSAVEQEVKASGAQVLQLNVNRHNPAKAFYETCGYTVAREEDIPIGPYWMNDFVMEKQL